MRGIQTCTTFLATLSFFRHVVSDVIVLSFYRCHLVSDNMSSSNIFGRHDLSSDDMSCRLSQTCTTFLDAISSRRHVGFWTCHLDVVSSRSSSFYRFCLQHVVSGGIADDMSSQSPLRTICRLCRRHVVSAAIADNMSSRSPLRTTCPLGRRSG